MNERVARRAQVLAAAAEVFARTGITHEEVAGLARMSKEELVDEVIARNLQHTLGLLRQVEEASGALLDDTLDAVGGAVQLELMAEATRNPKVADALRAADARVRERLRELLTGARGTLRHCDAADIESRIEMLLAIFGGMPLRTLMNPALNRDTLIAVVRPVLRVLLEP
jgi:AcrR family transcriptional regulator